MQLPPPSTTRTDPHLPYPALFRSFEMLGLDVEVVMGFKSRANGRMSTMRGETTIDYQTTPAYLKHVVPLVDDGTMVPRSEEHTSELQPLMRTSYAALCYKTKLPCTFLQQLT